MGIRFRFYGIRGTDHPEDYPPGLRQLMSVAPFWSVITDQNSIRAATPWRKALMFAAGETSTAIVLYPRRLRRAVTARPRRHTLLAFTIVWNAAATVVTAIKPKGDYAKARPRPSAPANPATTHPGSTTMTSPTVIDLATRIQRRRDFTAHLLGFLTGAPSCHVHLAGTNPNAQFAATLLIWATALSTQHFRHVLRGPVTTTDVKREQGR